MTKVERDKICKTCKNHIIDERYGILCGLTNNIPNFQDQCKDFNKVVEITPVFRKTSRSIHKKNEKKGFKSFLGAGISLWLIFKLIMLLIKFFNK
ncbi:hypothetical protein [Psychroserpens sp.]|uniref:hypothetical protein n=1 Tax=Psychroserpens sp. TaxID=2020870 RepID=UPI002B275748|nr:hypothetical protein [Psychroserpens sp.]